VRIHWLSSQFGNLSAHVNGLISRRERVLLDLRISRAPKANSEGRMKCCMGICTQYLNHIQ
jgi:hypothetical protein